MDYEKLVEALRLCVKYGKERDALENASQAADAIEELLQKTQQLEERLSGAVAFWDSVENNNIIMKLNPMFPDFISPAWQKAHKEMGFISPLADLYEELGVYDEPPKEEQNERTSRTQEAVQSPLAVHRRISEMA